MKRCPECRRDYVDDNLLYCLEDGAALVQGYVPSPDELPTAILHDTSPPSQVATRAQIHTTAAEAEHGDDSNQLTEKRGVLSNRAATPLMALALAAAVLVGGYLGYRHLSSGSKQIESLAVMPLVNDSGNAEIDYLSDGMTDTLISNLSHIPNLSVKARSSVFHYKGKETNPRTVGKELNVQAILNGRVASRKDQVTVTLELVDTQTENILWSEQYDRQQADVVSLQSELARDVSNKLRTRLSGADEQRITKAYTANPEAYELYLKGLFHWNKRTPEDLTTALDYFNKATQRDPYYGQAYAGLALTYTLLPEYSRGAATEMQPKAQAAARKALELDESLAEAHTALAYAIFAYSWNFAEADREFQRAIQLNPNYATAHQWREQILVTAQRFDEAVAEGKRAIELDPFSLIVNHQLASAFMLSRQYDRSIEQYNKILELDRNWYIAHWYLAYCYDMKGMYPEAISAYQRSRQLNDDPSTLAFLGHALAASGQKDEARKLGAQLTEMAKTQYVPAYYVAILYAGLGDKDKAFQWLERSFNDRGWDIAYLKIEPAFDPLHSDPRFAELVRKVGL